MSDTQISQKTLEVKIRTLPTQERQDQKDVSRVFFSKDTLLDLRLEAGQPCRLWKIDDLQSQSREAIAWPSSQKLNKNVLQMFKTFQETYGFRLEDRIAVAPSGDLQIASAVVLREITTNVTLNSRDISHWEWYLEDKLARAEILFQGMSFEVSLKGPRRLFVVESFLTSGQPTSRTIARFQEGSSVTIADETSAPSSEMQNGTVPLLQVPCIAGIEQPIEKLNNFLAAFHSKQAVEPSWGLIPCGVLLHGANGTGKTFIIKKISDIGWGKVFCVDSQVKPSALRDVFKDAKQTQRSIIIIDDIDLLISEEQTRSQELERILGEEMDNLATSTSSARKTAPKVVVIAATSLTNKLPRSIKKRGRFTTEILLPVPDTDARKRILRSLVPATAPDTQVGLLDKLGDRTHAYTGEDLGLLLDKACEIARRRREMAQLVGAEIDIYLLQEDIDEALFAVRPSAMHDITLQPPKVRWHEIGGQSSIKKALRRAVETPLLYPDLIRRLGATPKKGLLLYGPPGCSKTLSAQAMATEIGFNFFAVKGAELLNMYVGESERAVRDIFARARAASPSIIFFDEIESIGSKRDSGGRNNGINVLTTLLNEMDGIETLKGVTVLAATNKPEALDLALLRPGRFDDLLYVAPPDEAGREEIFQVRKEKMDWADDVDITRLAQLTGGYSGAEIVGICQAACDGVIDKALDTGDLSLKVHMDDFLAAVEKIKKQITPESIEGYKRWAAGIRSGFI